MRKFLKIIADDGRKEDRELEKVTAMYKAGIMSRDDVARVFEAEVAKSGGYLIVTNERPRR